MLGGRWKGRQMISKTLWKMEWNLTIMSCNSLHYVFAFYILNGVGKIHYVVNLPTLYFVLVEMEGDHDIFVRLVLVRSLAVRDLLHKTG